MGKSKWKTNCFRQNDSHLKLDSIVTTRSHYYLDGNDQLKTAFSLLVPQMALSNKKYPSPLLPLLVPTEEQSKFLLKQKGRLCKGKLSPRRPFNLDKFRSINLNPICDWARGTVIVGVRFTPALSFNHRADLNKFNQKALFSSNWKKKIP